MAADPDQNFDPDLLASIVAQNVDLHPLTPEDALTTYLNARDEELGSNTADTHRSRIGKFVEWCRENDITNLNELNGRHLQDFRAWRKQDLSLPSLESNMRTFRLFLKVCVKHDAVRPDLPWKVDIPSVSDHDASRDEYVPAETARVILDRLHRFHYATTVHVVWLLLATTGLRTGGLRALDLQDRKPGDDGGAILKLKHRPASDTSLKNKQRSERSIHIPEHVNAVIEDYLEEHRPSVTDAYGRDPLVATFDGRIAASTIRSYVYAWTRPCVIGRACPHGYDDDEIDSCEASGAKGVAYQCPSSLSPHSVRRGYITHELNAKVPKAVVSDDCDVSPEVIDSNYDARDPDEKLAVRREIRESIYNEYANDEYYQPNHDHEP